MGSLGHYADCGEATVDRAMVDRPIGQVEEQLNILTENTEHLTKCVAVLENKLAGLMTPPFPTENIGKEPRDLVPIAGHLRKENDQLSHLANMMQTIAERLEL